MHTSRTLVAGILLLAFLLPSPEASSLLSPPDGDGGCQECGTVTLMRSDGELIERPACLSAPFAAEVSGRRCRIEGESCIISDFCQFA